MIRNTSWNHSWIIPNPHTENLHTQNFSETVDFHTVHVALCMWSSVTHTTYHVCYVCLWKMFCQMCLWSLWPIIVPPAQIKKEIQCKKRNNDKKLWSKNNTTPCTVKHRRQFLKSSPVEKAVVARVCWIVRRWRQRSSMLILLTASCKEVLTCSKMYPFSEVISS